jgi:NADPH-dependent stearoyl-CoA 9-desaturase
MKRFAEAIDAIRDRVEADIGDKDVAYIKKVRRLSTAAEIAGRTLIHVSLDPVTFSAGVAALWLHLQLEATEIGHTALHGSFDGLPGADAFQSKGFKWRVPIDEESWKNGHNVRHHQYTNVAGKDPDIHFGPVRLTEHTPHRLVHYVQVPWLLWEASQFMWGMNMHFTGMIDATVGNGRPEQFDFLPDRSKASVRGAVKKMLRKFVPYYAREYVLFPALAGPFFWKVALGNWLASTIRDYYTAATIYCGHVGEDVADFPEGTKAHGRGEWYKMQIEAANNFEVPWAVSVLCGALDKQIEHHLFPRFPTQRLREIAPEVRKVCIEHGVEYRTGSWGETLGGVFRKLVKLSFPGSSSRRSDTSTASAQSDRPAAQADPVRLSA